MEFIMRLNKTARGFDIIEFTDRYNNSCSLQKSSIATEDCIWLGVTDPTPQVMATARERVVREQKEALDKIDRSPQYGWQDFPLHADVNIMTRMHLTRKQVKELLPHLIKFILTGRI